MKMRQQIIKSNQPFFPPKKFKIIIFNQNYLKWISLWLMWKFYSWKNIETEFALFCCLFDKRKRERERAKWKKVFFYHIFLIRLYSFEWFFVSDRSNWIGKTIYCLNRNEIKCIRFIDVFIVFIIQTSIC